MAPGCEVVEGEPSPTGAREAAIEYVSERLAAGARRATEGDAHGESRPGARAGSR
jgi:hypothetical protein